jgi:ABC-type glycerol-3-phosphate transport system substrate-binding protein
MKKVTRFVFPLLLALSILLSACGGGAPVETEAPAGGGGTAECPAGVQGQSFEMWSPFTGGDGDEMTALAERFSAENPCGITVTHVAQPEYVQKLEAGGSCRRSTAGNDRCARNQYSAACRPQCSQTIRTRSHGCPGR